jgi:S-adenosylmethionine:tRNA ribosyltransferase-isomerase
VEVLFLQATAGPVEALVRPTRRLRQGERLVHEEDGEVELVLVEHLGEGVWKVEARPSPLDLMARVGSTPLPPYIRRAAHSGDVRRYQTVFARDFGSSAAPTAGLHLTQALIARLAERGVGFATITLHVGIGTFRPLQQMDLDRGELHRESYFVSAETSGRIAETRARGARVLAVGTTTMRTLESAWDERTGAPRPGPGETRLFIREGHVFRSFDAFLTNFHLPRSSLLVLVGAWLGRDRLLEAYRHAITHGYRFYSYGDAMLVL